MHIIPHFLLLLFYFDILCVNIMDSFIQVYTRRISVYVYLCCWRLKCLYKYLCKNNIQFVFFSRTLSCHSVRILQR